MSLGHILFLAVSYRSDQDAVELIRSFEQLPDEPAATMILVDNYPRGGETGIPAGLLRRGRVIVSPENLGYFGGARFGLTEYLRTSAFPDLVVVSNVDVTLPDRALLTKALDRIKDQGIGVVAPAIVSEISGRDQNPFLTSRPSDRRMWLYSKMFAWYPLYFAYEFGSWLRKWLQPKLSAPCRSLASREIYAPHGAFMIFSKRYFECGNGLSYPLFLFGEEVFVAESCRQTKLKVVYDPAIRIHHREHVSTGTFRGPAMAKYVAQASRYAATNYFKTTVASTTD